MAFALSVAGSFAGDFEVILTEGRQRERTSTYSGQYELWPRAFRNKRGEKTVSTVANSAASFRTENDAGRGTGVTSALRANKRTSYSPRASKGTYQPSIENCVSKETSLYL